MVGVGVDVLESIGILPLCVVCNDPFVEDQFPVGDRRCDGVQSPTYAPDEGCRPRIYLVELLQLATRPELFLGRRRTCSTIRARSSGQRSFKDHLGFGFLILERTAISEQLGVRKEVVLVRS